MRAAVYRGTDDVRPETLPVPRIGPGELLVKVAVCGVCPTDIKKIQHGTVSPPRVFGHETAGTIVRAGDGVRGFAPGDRVALHHHVPCLDCHACRRRAFAQCATYKRTGITAGFEPAGGGYAQYVRVMPFVLPGVVKIPARNTFEEGAMLEPVNTVLKAVNRLRLLRGDRVLVVGQGPIGLMFTRLLHLRGMEVIATDLIDARLRLARDFGAKWTFNPAAPSSNRKPKTHNRQPNTGNPKPTTGAIPHLMETLIRRRPLDAAVIAVPSDDAVAQSMEIVRGGGQILLFAHTRRGISSRIDLASICVDEKDLIGSYSSDFTLQSEAARLVFSRKLDVRKLITHRFPLEETAGAIAQAASPAAGALKIIVQHDSAEEIRMTNDE